MCSTLQSTHFLDQIQINKKMIKIHRWGLQGLELNPTCFSPPPPPTHTHTHTPKWFKNMIWLFSPHTSRGVGERRVKSLGTRLGYSFKLVLQLTLFSIVDKIVLEC